MSTLAPLLQPPGRRKYRLELNTNVTYIERDALNKAQWQLRTQGDGDSISRLQRF
ncbi:MAG: hypothetical protein IPI09_20470 [Burkholderiales bacterium]|nr:hypothetical protein [Burkholderiales bacterium]